ncbi:MAG TPA: hypothetical protein PLD90_15445, partial [Rhodocyclaceae bacterium]|nr:hypothetical protein [Rhodocyclaceae bacterium]
MNDDQITPPAADPADASPPARRRAAPRAASRRKSADVPDTPEKPAGPAAGDAPASPQGDAPPTLAEATPRKRAAGKAKSPRAPSRRAPRGSARAPEPDNLSDTPPELPAARLVHLTDTLAHADREFLKQMKLTLRKGVQVFEKYEGNTLNHGKEELLEIAQSLPQVLV